MQHPNLQSRTRTQRWLYSWKRSLIKYWDLYLLIVPVLIWLAIFKYGPMYGTIIAFENYSPSRGVFGSKWVGFKHFERFFNAYNFKDILLNTIKLSLLQLVCAFPMPILLALVLNELNNKRYKKLVQTVTYSPFFLSTVVMVGLIDAFLYPNTGLLNVLVTKLGGQSINYMAKDEYFRPIFIISHIWKGTGWASIIYMSALTSVDPQLYEAARIDGANRLQALVHVTIPAIIPTAIIMLIRDCGSIMDVGFEKVYLMQNDLNMGASEVISTYVYKVGMVNSQYSYSTAVNLFNSMINLAMLLLVNKISRTVSETSLW
ncbi:MAG: sugar ABC transporter permease [Clostridiales bacterium]|nr:sugar ABC transporter permease [Clostridiales bacterium]